jgi:hypothetical protein
MKTRTVVTSLVISVVVVAILGSCAASRKTMIESESISINLTGTWLNNEYDDMLQLPARINIHSDGSYDLFEDVDDAQRSWWGQHTILESWTDSTGTYWYKAIADDNWTNVVTYYELGKIDATKTVWEFLQYSVRVPNKWEPDNNRYIYRVYYRK